MAPSVVLMKGHPGTGKSTLARALARFLRFPLLDKDDVKDCTLFLQSPVSRRTTNDIGNNSHSVHLASTSSSFTKGCSTVSLDTAYGDKRDGNAVTSNCVTTVRGAIDVANVDAGILNTLSYEVLWRMADTQLSLGLSLIIDTPLSRPELFHRVRSLTDIHGARLMVLECLPKDNKEWRRRLESRAKAAMELQGPETAPSSQGLEPEALDCSASERSWHKPASWEDMEELLVKYNGCWKYDIGSTPYLVLDTTGLTQEEVLVEALSWLQPQL